MNYFRPYSEQSEATISKDFYFREKYFLFTPLCNITKIILFSIILLALKTKLIAYYAFKLAPPAHLWSTSCKTKADFHNLIKSGFNNICNLVYGVKYLYPYTSLNDQIEREALTKGQILKKFVYTTLVFNLFSFFTTFKANHTTFKNYLFNYTDV